jgi:hypothetical protein
MIAVDPQYRAQGIAKAMYGLVLTKMKRTLVAGDSQSPGGRKNWLSLAQIPGVSVKGYVAIDNRLLDSRIDTIMGKLGGEYIGSDLSNRKFFAFDVLPGTNELKPAVVTSLNKIYSGALPTGLYATWSGTVNEQGVAEENELDERAIAQAQYMQGECAVLAITIHKMDPQRFPLGFVYEFFDSMPDIYIEPDEFDELDPARQQDIQNNHQNWSLTHAYVFDQKTQKYIDARGSHDSPPNIGHHFNATRHNKFPAKIQDLVNVSSYMEWDEAQEKWIVLRGWDALDKAYTPEDQQRAREYAIKYLGVRDSSGKSIENENFADGRNPQDKGDSKRHGVPTKASVSTLRKVAKQGGRKGQLAHWMANMKAGRAKAKRNK